VRLTYPPFKRLVKGISEEWLDRDLLVGNLASLGHDRVAAPLCSWVLKATAILRDQTGSKHLTSRASKMQVVFDAESTA